MFRIMLFILAVVLILSSCTRFDSEFDPPVTIDFEAILFVPLQAAFDTSTAIDLSAVMSYYDDNYLHNGQNVTARESFFRSMFDITDTPQFTVTFLQSVVENDTLASSNWRLRVFMPDNRTLLADSTFTGEKLIMRDGVWKLWGNRIATVNPPARQRAILESFTYVGCSNCPPVKQALYELELQYPLDVTYLEYHVAEPFNSGAQDLYAYYGYPAIPVVIVQGSHRLIGNSSENLAMYQKLAQSIIQSDAQIMLSDLAYTYTPGVQIAGSVEASVLPDGFDTQNLRLRYVLFERVRNFGNPPITYRNVVMRKGESDISASDLSQPLSFALPFDGVLPDDAYLLVFVQRVPTVFAANATIYNGIEVPVLPAK